MNYVQLVNRLISECGSALSPLSTVQSPPAGETTRMINWISDAWNEIQLEQYEWDWARPWIQWTTTSQVGNYTWQSIFPIAVNQVTGTSMTSLQLQQWVNRSARCEVTSGGIGSEQILNFMDWDDFRNVYRYATQRANFARPVIWTRAPDKSIWLGPIPDGASGQSTSFTGSISGTTLTVSGSVSGPGIAVGQQLSGSGVAANTVVLSGSGTSWQVSVSQTVGSTTIAAPDSYLINMECWLAPQVLSADTDAPIMPPQYHMAVVYRAMLKYAGYESAPEVSSRAEDELQQMMNKIYIDQLPVLHSGPPLATDERP